MMPLTRHDHALAFGAMSNATKQAAGRDHPYTELWLTWCDDLRGKLIASGAEVELVNLAYSNILRGYWAIK